METTIKYEITELRSGTRKGEDREITLVKAVNKETEQVIELVDFELHSMRLGDELEVTVKNNEQS